MSATKKCFPRTQVVLLSTQLIGDALISFAGLSIAYVLRFQSPLRYWHWGAHAATSTYAAYLPLISLGAVFLLATYAYLNVYDSRLLLRPRLALLLILRGVAFWLVAFVATTLVFKLEPSISRAFALIAAAATLLATAVWRTAFDVALRRSGLRVRLTQNVVIVGWNREAAELVDAINRDENHPYRVLGVVRTSAPLAPINEIEAPTDFGTLSDLPAMLGQPLIDMLVLADLDLPRTSVVGIAADCERTYTDFKIVPSFFQIFLSNLRLQTVSGVPIMGVENLSIRRLHNAILKRAIDIAGALVGLFASAPIIAVLAVFIKAENSGPILYRQVRTGRHGRPFHIYKLRSMRADAETRSGARWAVKADPRRTRIGAFMRETNLDELPQFWNVLKGEMSLVGPRPERPELITRFEKEIPHYNPRHVVRPGITGWAQVNGLRGDTSLVERVRYDLYYIENWSAWFDFSILLQTFFRRENAY